jgi:tetratricopeptide (TPR) repeat protein
MGSHNEMLRAFSRAIRLDARAARFAACEEPEEVGLINGILFPLQPQPFADESAMPTTFKEAGDLVALAMNHLMQERDEEAKEALEQSLRIDPSFPLTVALLDLLQKSVS